MESNDKARTSRRGRGRYRRRGRWKEDEGGWRLDRKRSTLFTVKVVYTRRAQEHKGKEGGGYSSSWKGRVGDHMFRALRQSIMVLYSVWYGFSIRRR